MNNLVKGKSPMRTMPLRDASRSPDQWGALWRPVLALLVLSGVGNSMLGCSGDTTGTAPLHPANQIYWTLQLNHHAVNLALAAPAGQPVVDTVRLSVTPRTVAGTLLPGSYPVHYGVQDSSVTVDSTGLVTAHFPTQGQSVPVVATLTAQSVTLVDTAFIQVVDSAPPAALATLVFQLAPGDSAKTAYSLFGGSGPTLPIVATDTHRDTLCNSSSCALQVAFTSSDPTIATIDLTTGAITPQQPGHVTFYATTWAYGVTKQDSLPYIIGYPLFSFIVIGRNAPVGGQGPGQPFTPSVLVVGTGATVIMENVSVDSIDVVFDDSTAVGGGATQVFAGDTLGNAGILFYQFTTLGTYTYRSRKYGISGTIDVSSGP